MHSLLSRIIPTHGTPWEETCETFATTTWVVAVVHHRLTGKLTVAPAALPPILVTGVVVVPPCLPWAWMAWLVVNHPMATPWSMGVEEEEEASEAVREEGVGPLPAEGLLIWAWAETWAWGGVRQTWECLWVRGVGPGLVECHHSSHLRRTWVQGGSTWGCRNLHSHHLLLLRLLDRHLWMSSSRRLCLLKS